MKRTYLGSRHIGQNLQMGFSVAGLAGESGLLGRGLRNAHSGTVSTASRAAQDFAMRFGAVFEKRRVLAIRTYVYHRGP